MSDIFREVDEEVRQDKALEFWVKYQNLLIMLALLIVAIAGGWRTWQHFQTKAAEAAGAKYESALTLARDGKTAEAQVAFDALGKDSPAGYRALGRLRAAAELSGTDGPAAVKAYDAMASDATMGPLMQDVAKLRAAMLRIDAAEPAEIEQRLAPLAASGQAFRNSARELLALSALKRDDFGAAGRWLDQIVVDSAAPANMRRRAEALLGLVRAGKPPAK